jgi:hypothetical protein
MVSSVMWRARRPDSRAGQERLRGGGRVGDATASFVRVPERRLSVSDLRRSTSRREESSRKANYEMESEAV